MKEIPLYDAKNGLSALVTEVETTGESVIITRHGKPAACLSAVRTEDRAEARRALARSLLDRLERDAPGAPGPGWSELKADMDADRP